MNSDDFITRLRNARDSVQAEDQRRSDIINTWNDLLSRYAEDYKVYRDNSKMEKMDTEQSKQALRDFVYQSGLRDGKWEDDNYDDLEFQEYGTNLLNNIFDNATTFDKYVDQYGSESQKKTFERNQKRAEKGAGEKAARGLLGGSAALSGAIAGGPLFAMGESLGLGIPALANQRKQKELSDFYDKYEDDTIKKLNAGFDLISNYDDYLSKASELPDKNKTTIASTETSASDLGDGFGDDESEGEIIEYTYKPGDTFGQVLLDLGLTTDKGLWGKGGDVEFYDKQLWSQGAPDPVTGFIPVGTTIKLRKRK